MEHQSWSIENSYTYREFLLLCFKVFQPFLIPAFLLLFFYLLIIMLIAVDWHFPSFDILGYCMGFTLILSLVTSITIIICLLPIFFLGYLMHKSLFPISLEISADGLRAKSLKRGVESLLHWHAIKKNSQQFDLIFVECRIIFIPQFIVIPFRLFTDQAEGERFYADLNYFWEQGR